MRASDIVTQLAIKLPTLVDDFTLNHNVVSLTRAGTTVTVTTTTDHNLSSGKAVNIVGARTPISILSIDRIGIIARLETETDHDITKTIGFENVEIEGANEPEFNGTFKLLNVESRRIITFQVEDAGPTNATGSPLLINGENIFNTYNGIQEITAVPTTTTFEYEVTNSNLFTPAAGIIFAKTTPLISAAVTYDRIVSSYTKQVSDNIWIFVVMGDGISQKNRNITVDSTDNISRVHYFNQRITQTLSLYLFIPATNEIAARQARDRAEELLLPISQSILFAKFDSLLSTQFVNPLQFNEHGFHDYNSAFYVHRYTFEETLQMTFEDTVGPDCDVAFRDIELTIGLDVGTETFETDINLDIGSPEFTPKDLSNLFAWYDADDNDTITKFLGLVSKWDDKSGNGFDLIQTIGSAQPRSNSTTINELNTIDFDGVDDYLFNDTDSTLHNIINSDYTLFFVFDLRNITGVDCLIAWNKTTAPDINNTIYCYSDGIVNFDQFFLGIDILSVSLVSRISPNLSNILQLITLSSNFNNNITTRLNGIEESIQTINTPPAGADIFGICTEFDQPDPGNFINGSMGELIIYNRLLTSDEIDQVETYLTNKWPFNPKKLLGLSVWLDANDASTITEENGGVEEWIDKSNNNNNAIQTISAQRPENGATINTFNAISWDDIDDTLVLPDSSFFDTFFLNGGTISFISNSPTLGQNDLGRFFDKETNWRISKMGVGVERLQFNVKFTGDDLDFITIDNSLIIGSPTIITITYDASSTSNSPSIYFDGVLQTFSTASLPTGTMEIGATGPLRIGGREIFINPLNSRTVDADFGEIIIVNRVVSEQELGFIHNYLSSKWGITIP